LAELKYLYKLMSKIVKFSLQCIALSLVILLLNGCATIKVLNTWKADDLPQVKDKNILVITRTSNLKVRKIFEDAFMKQLKANNINGNVSYNLIKAISDDKKVTPEKVEAAKKAILDNGYDAVVLTILKDRKSTVTVTQDGGYTAGATYSSEINPFLYDFYTAFGSPYAAPSLRHSGYYEEETFQEQEYVTFILETLIYSLDETDKEPLKAQVTSKLESPGSAIEVADAYARKVAKALKQ